MVAYDDVKELRKLYKNYPMYLNKLNFSAQIKRIGTKLLILNETLTAPQYLAEQKILEAA